MTLCLHPTRVTPFMSILLRLRYVSFGQDRVIFIYQCSFALLIRYKSRLEATSNHVERKIVLGFE